MSIADKLVAVAENEPKVYRGGQLSVLKSSETLKGSDSGEIISITDVSPIEHNVGVKVGSKNLFNIEKLLEKHANKEWVNNNDYIVIALQFKPNTQYYLKCYGERSGQPFIISDREAVNTSPSTAISISTNWDAEKCITTSDSGLFYFGCVNFHYYTTDEVRAIVEKAMLQIEEGPTATPYTPYIENFAPKQLPILEGLLTDVSFEETDFSYLRSTIFTVPETGSYTFAINVADESKWTQWVLCYPTWAADDSPSMYGDYMTETVTLHAGETYRLFIGSYNGLKPSDILSATIAMGDNVVAPDTTDSDGVTVTSTGKNLLNLEGREVVNFGGWGNETKRTFPGGKGIIMALASNNYYSNAPKAEYTIDKNSFSYKETASFYGIGLDLKLLPSTTYQFSYSTLVGGVALMEYDIEGNYLGFQYFNSSVTTKSKTAWGIILISDDTKTVSVTNPQLEYGSTITEYESPIAETNYTPNADGTVDGVTSVYPTMNISTDTAGVIITTEYIKDINKVYNEQIMQVALSGGE